MTVKQAVYDTAKTIPVGAEVYTTDLVSAVYHRLHTNGNKAMPFPGTITHYLRMAPGMRFKCVNNHTSLYRREL